MTALIDITAPPFEPEELADRLRRAPWRRYVTLGDSLIVGLGDPVEGYPNMAWTEATGQAFKRLLPDFESLHLGKPYLTARQVREEQLQPALDFEPDLATVLAGGNDLGDPFDPEGIERELDTMVAALTDTGAPPRHSQCRPNAPPWSPLKKGSVRVSAVPCE